MSKESLAELPLSSCTMISKVNLSSSSVFTWGTVTSNVRFVVLPPICGAISEATVCEIIRTASGFMG